MPGLSAIRWLWPALALLGGLLGICAIWVAASVLSGRSCSWLALVAAIDMALLLRLTNAPAGRLRMAVAVATTAAAIALSQWLLAATNIGILLGLHPLDSALRLGPALAWELVQLNLSRVDWILMIAALPLSAILLQTRRANPDDAP